MSQITVYLGFAVCGFFIGEISAFLSIRREMKVIKVNARESKEMIAKKDDRIRMLTELCSELTKIIGKVDWTKQKS